MRLIYIGALFLSLLVSGQTDYPNLPVSHVPQTDEAGLARMSLPWGSRTANNTNPYGEPPWSDPPNTGHVVSQEWTIKRAECAPDGYTKQCILINGQFPGPMIEANWGDTIEITVKNEIEDPDEGVSVHWHGILQKASQWMDGVPGIQQCPIPPKSSFTYRFIADLYGTSWYHSHYSAQYVAGTFGPLIIHGPETVPYDIDIGPVLLTDYFHEDYYSLVEQVMSTDSSVGPPRSVNNLINGRNNFDCSTLNSSDTAHCISDAGLSSFRFTPGKKHRLRLINAGAEGIQKFAIDGHQMTVIANDFVPVQPYDSQAITLGVGQRTDIIIEAPSDAKGSYWMRSSIPGNCSLTYQPDATAIVYYGEKSTPTTTPSQDWRDSLSSCNNDALSKTIPWFEMKTNLNPATTQTIDVTSGQNASGVTLFKMNNSSFRADYNSPILLLSNTGNNSYPDSPEWNVYNFGSNSSIRIVITNGGGIAHPMHLHGHNFFVEDVGVSGQEWDGSVVRSDNPQRRDTQILPVGGYIVLQVAADNPGVWPLHCHIAWHVSAGLYVTVMERPADIKRLSIPRTLVDTCKDWATFANTEVVDQIDSGL